MLKHRMLIFNGLSSKNADIFYLKKIMWECHLVRNKSKGWKRPVKSSSPILKPNFSSIAERFFFLTVLYASFYEYFYSLLFSKFLYIFLSCNFYLWDLLILRCFFIIQIISNVLGKKGGEGRWGRISANNSCF